MTDAEDNFSAEDEATFDRADRALEETPISPEQHALEVKASAHDARLNARLLELTRTDARKYVKLRNRVGSLVFFLKHYQHPETPEMIVRGTRLVADALEDIDPYYATRGLSPDDYARYKELDSEHMGRTIDRLYELEAQDKEQQP